MKFLWVVACLTAINKAKWSRVRFGVYPMRTIILMQLIIKKCGCFLRRQQFWLGFPWHTGLKGDGVRAAHASDHIHAIMPLSSPTSHARELPNVLLTRTRSQGGATDSQKAQPPDQLFLLIQLDSLCKPGIYAGKPRSREGPAQFVQKFHQR